MCSDGACWRLIGRDTHRNDWSCYNYNRGVIQGDIPSPEYFIAALDILLKEHGGIDNGFPLTPTITLSDLEYADDAALTNQDVTKAGNRITHLDSVAQKSAGMSISIPKMKVQQRSTNSTHVGNTRNRHCQPATRESF